MSTRFEIVKQKSKVSTRNFQKDYKTHIGFGAAGMFYDKLKVGYIWSFKLHCLNLIKQGYAHLKFCNGGDDDVLVIDHQNKEFGFFENPAPTIECCYKYSKLTSIWENHN